MSEPDLDRIIEKHSREGSEERNPEIAEQNFSLGEEAFGREDYREAAGHFNVAFSNDPDERYLRKKVDSINELLQQGKFDIDDFISESRNAIIFEPGYGRYHFLLAWALDNKGITNEAVEEARRAVELMPDVSSYHHNLAFYLNKLGESEQAKIEYGEAIRLEPNNFLSHFNLALILLDKKEYDNAFDELRSAIKLKSDHADSHYQLGRVYGKKGMLDEAIDELKKAIELNPEDAVYHNRLGLILDKDGWARDAIEEFREAIRLNPEVAAYHYNLALTLKEHIHPLIEEEKTERIKEAEQEYRAAIDIDPDFDDARKGLAGIVVEKGIEKYTKWRSEDNLNADAYLFSEAKHIFEEAITMDDSNILANIYLGDILHIEHRLSEAIDHYNRAMELNFEEELSRGDQVVVYFHIGLAFYNYNDIEKGISYLEEALEKAKSLTKDDSDRKTRTRIKNMMMNTLSYMRKSTDPIGRTINRMEEAGVKLNTLLSKVPYIKPTDMRRTF